MKPATAFALTRRRSIVASSPLRRRSLIVTSASHSARSATSSGSTSFLIAISLAVIGAIIGEYIAAERGLDGVAHERLMKAYFTEGRPIGDRETLADLAAEIGLDRDEVVAMLNSDDYGNHVRSDEATATMLGITGVPFFVFDRKYGVSGAQPVDVLTQALETAWSTRHERPEPVTASAGCGGGCGSGGCGGACAR